jgi:hypothetical protein
MNTRVVAPLMCLCLAPFLMAAETGPVEVVDDTPGAVEVTDLRLHAVAVFEDTNSNGLADINELPLGAVPVNLVADGQVLWTGATDRTGRAEVHGSPAAMLHVIAPEGWRVTGRDTRGGRVRVGLIPIRVVVERQAPAPVVHVAPAVTVVPGTDNPFTPQLWLAIGAASLLPTVLAWLTSHAGSRRSEYAQAWEACERRFLTMPDDATLYRYAARGIADAGYGAVSLGHSSFLGCDSGRVRWMRFALPDGRIATCATRGWGVPDCSVWQGRALRAGPAADAEMCWVFATLAERAGQPAMLPRTTRWVVFVSDSDRRRPVPASHLRIGRSVGK